MIFLFVIFLFTIIKYTESFLLLLKKVFKSNNSGVGTVGRGDYRNYYKGHMDKTRGEGGGGGGRRV